MAIAIINERPAHCACPRKYIIINRHMRVHTWERLCFWAFKF